MNKSLVTLSFALSALMLAVAHEAMAAAIDPLDQLKIEVNLESAKDATLRFKLTNTTKIPIAFWKPRLPWGNVNSVAIVVLRPASFYTALKGMRPFDTPLDDEVLIEPGQSVSGIVDVREYAKDLESELRKRDLLVLWSYQPRTRDGVIMRRHTGHVELIRQKN
jgi:hypothetical protein